MEMEKKHLFYRIGTVNLRRIGFFRKFDEVIISAFAPRCHRSSVSQTNTKTGSRIGRANLPM